MSVWKNLLNRAVNSVVPESWAAAFSRLAHEDLMKAFTGCCALVVCADNVVEESEVDKVREYIRSNLKLLKGYDAGVVMRQFNEYVDITKCDPDEGRDSVYKVLQEIKTDAESCKTLVRICCKLGAAGSDFNEAEKQVIKGICEQLNVDFREFKEIC